MARTRLGDDGHRRCAWCGDDPLYVRYHDEEWGVPVGDDRLLFEKLCLEGFQSGLSWLTILRKREHFRAAFAGFDVDEVARFTARDVRRLLADAGIVRHRGKIEATIANARAALPIVAEFGSLAGYLWGFAPTRPPPRLATQTAQSVALSKDLKRRGWRFVGPTTVHAFMQAMGMVNDHLPGCGWRAACLERRRDFAVPRKRL
ncbi:MAG: DNA-3-methyladenine glycosylase I [Planctomycetes bacterium]|nr:DNA-3-methyladenine glycosylase I [Planctomycetota bacterium]